VNRSSANVINNSQTIKVMNPHHKSSGTMKEKQNAYRLVDEMNF
jgi:hypothetical protein